MRITFQYEKAVRFSAEMLALSRRVRQAGYEVDDVTRELRSDALFEESRQTLRGQMETLSVLTARLVGLSTVLAEVAELYARAESRNEERLDGGAGWYQPPRSGAVRQGGGELRARMERILRQ